jgi:proton-dependent oligopeptide transporter, POT family
MEKIKNQKHTKETFLYALSRTLERASFYGLRSLIVLYMIGEILQMENVEALKIYGWFTASFLFSKIIGAILGDLIIGNKKAVIIGGIIQALGAFSFYIPSTTGLYIGLFLVVFGGGLYTPNIISNFGKLYLNKTKLLDAGFTIFYLAVNLGAFFGIMSIGYLGEKYGWNIGFIIAGILMLLSIIPIIFSKDKKNEQTTENKATVNQRIINIIIAFVIVSLFWSIYEIGNIRIFDLQLKLSEISTLNIPKSMWTSLNSVFILPISILAIIAWTFFYNNQFFKLTIGFIFGAISFGILFLIPEIPTEKHTIIYLLSLLFLSISEIHITPIIYSILTKNSNPKYLAILISLAFIPTRLFSFLFSLFSEKFYDNPIFSLKFGLIAMIIVSIGLIIFVKWKKKNYLQQRV